MLLVNNVLKISNTIIDSFSFKIIKTLAQYCNGLYENIDSEVVK